MYKVYLDGELLYHPSVDTLSLASGKLEIELNKTGKFVFGIYKNNTQYGNIKKMQSIIKVYDDDYRLFRGRVLNSKRGFYNSQQVTCEGELAFLLDSRVRPYSFQGSVEEYFAFLVNNHNAKVTEEWKKFKVGNCTVTDPNNYITRASSDYPKTLNEMKEKLVDILGGYLWTREEEDGIYIDYLADFELTNIQEIKFGKNLLDLEEVIKGQDVATVIIPLGAKLTDENGNETSERLTIKDINNGLDYIYDAEAVERHGWIEKTVKYDDVTVAENLLKKGQAELVDAVKMTQTIDLSAADLHALGVDIQAFRLGRYTIVESEPHNFNDKFLTRKQTIDILKPANSNLSLGDERRTFVDKQVETSQNVQKVESVTNDLKDKVANSEHYVDSEIDKVKEIIIENNTTVINDCEQIIFSALESYVETGDYEEFRQTVTAELEILADRISMNFNETITELENVNGDLQQTITTLSKYFDFGLDGLAIRCGESPISSHFDNDIIIFKRNGVVFGWWDGINFHTGNIVVDVNERAQFGNFAYIPEEDGGLSFLKVDSSVLVNKIIYISASHSTGKAYLGTNFADVEGITVTAAYSDGTTAEITGYTISDGQIADGTNIITITYEGKTSRISVEGVVNDGIDLGEPKNCVVHAWLNKTSTAGKVYYADGVELVDGEVVLSSDNAVSFYQNFTSNSANNKYDRLLGKYVKSFLGDIYYIDPDASYVQNTIDGDYVYESIVYTPAYLCSPTE